MEEEYVKPSEVAKRLGVTRGAVYKWIREGKLEAVRFGDNAVRIRRSALAEFERKAAQQEVQSENKQPTGLAVAFQGAR